MLTANYGRTGPEWMPSARKKSSNKKIQIELNDELTHPRVRKTRQQKLELALTRIEQSELTEEEKNNLYALYKRLPLSKRQSFCILLSLNDRVTAPAVNPAIKPIQ
nr:hypothetical protein [Planococcus glaciei]